MTTMNEMSPNNRKIFVESFFALFFLVAMISPCCIPAWSCVRSYEYTRNGDERKQLCACIPWRCSRSEGRMPCPPASYRSQRTFCCNASPSHGKFENSFHGCNGRSSGTWFPSWSWSASESLHKGVVVVIGKRHVVLFVSGPVNVVLSLLPHLLQLPILPHHIGGAVPLPQDSAHGVDLLIEANDFCLELINFVIHVCCDLLAGSRGFDSHGHTIPRNDLWSSIKP